MKYKHDITALGNHYHTIRLRSDTRETPQLESSQGKSRKDRQEVSQEKTSEATSIGLACEENASTSKYRKHQ